MSTTVFVYTLSRTGEVGAWSRYLFPFEVDNFERNGDDLYIRAGDDLLKVDASVGQDFVGDSRAQNYDCTVQWPWLDFGQPGVTKMLAGLDVTTKSAASAPLVAIGYDQTDVSKFTADYALVSDTVPGTFIPLTVMAPTFSLRLKFIGLDKWTVYSATLYLQDQRATA